MRLLFLLSISSFFFSCSQDSVYEKYSTTTSTWHQDSVYVFDFELKDNLTFDVIALMKFGREYPFYNLYVEYEIKKDDELIRKELEEIILFDEKTGQPLGKGIANSFDYEHELLENFTFPGNGKYTIELRQFMRMDELESIFRVGIALDPIKPNAI